ncbi:hypothetical protein ABZP36_017620 [Zizania latifolia]
MRIVFELKRGNGSHCQVVPTRNSELWREEHPPPKTPADFDPHGNPPSPLAPPLFAPRFHAALPRRLGPQKLPSWRRAARPSDEDYYLIYVPESIGDGFSFSGGFGFSDKPQPEYGFHYTLNEYTSSLESLINALASDKLSIVVQGYFAPIVVKYANKHQDKLNHLILVNPPGTMCKRIVVKS